MHFISAANRIELSWAQVKNITVVTRNLHGKPTLMLNIDEAMGPKGRSHQFHSFRDIESAALALATLLAEARTQPPAALVNELLRTDKEGAKAEPLPPHDNPIAPPTYELSHIFSSGNRVLAGSVIVAIVLIVFFMLPTSVDPASHHPLQAFKPASLLSIQQSLSVQRLMSNVAAGATFLFAGFLVFRPHQ